MTLKYRILRVLFQSMKIHRDSAPADDDRVQLGTTLAQHERYCLDLQYEVDSDSNWPQISKDNDKIFPDHAHISRSHHNKDQLPGTIGVQSTGSTHRVRSCATDDQSSANVGAESQPIAELILREFELLRAAPSHGN